MVTAVDENLTEEIDESDYEKTDEEEDPLFGKFENDKELGLLLSPKKKRKQVQNARIPLISDRSHLKCGNMPDDFISSSAPKKRKFDILEQLQAHMKNPLDKELGFSINKAMQYSADQVFASRDFKNLLGSVKREREIEDILNNADSAEERKKILTENIEHWVRNHVSSDFLDAETEGVKVHARWVHNLEKMLKELTRENGDSFDEACISQAVRKNHLYCHFKCFTNKGVTSMKYIHRLSILQEYNAKYLLESLDKNYIESFPPTVAIGEEYRCHEVLSKLGFNLCLLKLSESGVCLVPAERDFDSKAMGPVGGSALQALKFIKLLDNQSFTERCTSREILPPLVLMSCDSEILKDSQRYYYNHTSMSISEILRLKLRQNDHHITIINEVLKQLFLKNCPDLWFDLIRSFVCVDQRDVLFVTKLIIFFLKENDVGDKVVIEEDIEALATPNDIFDVLYSCIEKLSRTKFALEYEILSDVVLMKIELLKIFVILIEPTMGGWQVDPLANGGDDRQKKFHSMKTLILRIKNNYFSEYQNYNSAIPKCKRLLDFIYHQMAGDEVGDFFAEGDGLDGRV